MAEPIKALIVAYSHEGGEPETILSSTSLEKAEAIVKAHYAFQWHQWKVLPVPEVETTEN